MSRVAAAARWETIAELLAQLGGISPQRVRLKPPPGKATEADLIKLNAHTDHLYELVDGTLVEKVMGYPESSVAGELFYLLRRFLDDNDLGNLAVADGTMRLMPGLVRIPDISFVRWERFPGRVIPSEPIAGLAPDLAVEVLSKSNTKKEMERKLKEYFLSGAHLVWFVDPKRRTVEVFTAPDQSTLLTEEQTLDGGDVLPGLAIPVRQIFARMPRPQTPSAKKGSSAKGKKRRQK
jgi:Uma2 family endonuclease